jgi:hypothetical protein
MLTCSGSTGKTPVAPPPEARRSRPKPAAPSAVKGAGNSVHGDEKWFARPAPLKLVFGGHLEQ